MSRSIPPATAPAAHAAPPAWAAQSTAAGRRTAFVRIGLSALGAALLLAACGRAGPPQAPGPKDQITYPQVYPSK